MGQRSTKGLIINEAMHISPNVVGCASTLVIWYESQVEGWQKVTDRIHILDGLIFAQLFHTGRMLRSFFLKGKQPLAPSDIKADHPINILGCQNEPMQVSSLEVKAMIEVDQIKNEFVVAAGNSVAAEFNGVGIHAANGYLLKQFLNPYISQRTGKCGGSIEK